MVMLVHMCACRMEFLEAQDKDLFAEHLEFMRKRGNMRPSGAKSEWLVQVGRGGGIPLMWKRGNMRLSGAASELVVQVGRGGVAVGP